MAIYKYNRYKILISPDSKKTQGLEVGDVVRRQYFDKPNAIYSLMVVLETGVDVIGSKDSPYFIGALLEGDEPKTGELLDFVRVTSLVNRERTGALYMTASDSESPFLDVIDGMGMENSLCFPFMKDGRSEIADKRKYACFGAKYLNTDYHSTENDVHRILSISRNGIQEGTPSFGLKQSVGLPLKNPMRAIVSFKIRADDPLENVRIQFGYSDGKEIDGYDFIHIGTEWEYKLVVVTIDYPSQYQRSFSIDLTNQLLQEKAGCQIADLNIILQSDISIFTNATKVRIGKLQGVIDPVFGVLDGYGAYFQNLYATKNVNIAGTLTAGDENGFSSTFYVGKIHKNVILNSIACEFEGSDVSVTDNDTPIGIGKVCQLGKDSTLKAQTWEWKKSHLNEMYCFSIWVKASEDSTIYLYQDWYMIGSFKIEANKGWQRYHASFLIQDSEDSPFFYMKIRSSTTLVKVSAPQLEAGSLPSQNQPTDGILSVVEDYGAWFSKGGIGGTIQNPLLKLNEDGSISSRDNSFVIKPDGTGYFASGRFKWTKDTIILQDVTIKWEDLDDNAKDNLSPITIDIVSRTGFTIKNSSNNIEATAHLSRNGQTLDISGTEYTYMWDIWNKNGTSVVKTLYGKTISVLKSDVADTAVLTCEISKFD
ncbi:hypothetical protein [Dysgonomonas sp. GY617]|uniref:hypothetical protein n=1 Tax=Dysgonomonas sp. GY617 TaxID=2780420 RepID=UPI001883BF05|nr:hypothetical protein [Dysgonomonas sp. GY617]MBF0577374.1 hypothetical protein [Dysgonomonas sp. GY617]